MTPRVPTAIPALFSRQAINLFVVYLFALLLKSEVETVITEGAFLMPRRIGEVDYDSVRNTAWTMPSRPTLVTGLAEIRDNTPRDRP